MEIQQGDQNYQYALYRAGQEERASVNYGAYDNVEGQDKNLSFDNQSIRRGFIRKVYLILMGQLLVTFAAVSLFVLSEDVKNFATVNPGVFWVAVVVMLVTMLFMVCCENVRRKTPTNFIFLGMFTVAESFLLGVSASRFAPKEVLLAIGITAAICLSLTLFALQTKYDFTIMGGVLISCVMALLIFGLVAIFMPGRIMALIYSSVGAVLFSIYLIYDTQLMIGGKHKYCISPEEYIFATLNLYLDVTNIFLNVLAILGLSRD